MIRGLYTSASGMMTQTKLMDVISNNLANADTASFKKDNVISSSFKDVLTKKIDEQGNENIGKMRLGVYADETHTNFSQGSIKQTDKKLDFAIHGDGFFTIEHINKDGEKSERYTRNGSFTMNNQGQLATGDGELVLSKEGTPITLPNEDVYISDIGTIFSGKNKLATMKIVNFENPNSLSKMGNGLYKSSDVSIQKDFDSKILQGNIEASNVNVIQEMVDMISVTRNYEANQKLITIHDQMLEKSVNNIGRV